MSQEEKDQQQAAAQVTFREDPILYCQRMFTEYEEHNNALATEVQENWDYYYGHDSILDERAMDEGVVRSASYIPEIQPALDTILANFVDNITQGPNPVRIIQADDQDYDPELIRQREVELNEDLRRAGFLTSGAQDLILAAACQPIAAVKTGWHIEEGPHFVKKSLPLSQHLARIYEMLGMKTETVAEEYGVIGEWPYADVLNWDQFLYDKSKADFRKGQGVIFRNWLTASELESEGARQGWKKSAVSQLKEMGPYGTDSEGAEALDSDDDELDRYHRSPYTTGKYMVCEFWLPVRDKKGQEWIRVYTLGNNKIPLFKEKFGIQSHFGRLKYPFVIHRTGRKFNEIEGLPWVTQIKGMARLLNDCFNIFSDAFSYGVLPVIAIPTLTEFEEEPEWFPGAFWPMDNPQDLNVVRVELGDLKILISMIELISDRIRQIINAPDIAQGIPQSPQEKATKTLQRAQGVATRARGIFKNIGDMVINVAQQFVYLYQAAGRPEWLIDITLDVPALTNLYPAALEQQIWLAFLESAKANPIYAATPLGVVYIRAITEMVYRKYGIKNTEEYMPTEEQLEVAMPRIIHDRHEAERLKQLKDQAKMAATNFQKTGEVMEGGGGQPVKQLST